MIFLILLVFLVLIPGCSTSCTVNNGGCQDTCEDTNPGVRCSCSELGTLSTDDKSCISKAALYFTDQSGNIVFLTNPRKQFQGSSNTIPSHKIVSASAPDFNKGRIFYSTFSGVNGSSTFLIFELSVFGGKKRLVAQYQQGIIFDMVYNVRTNSLYLAGIKSLAVIQDVDAALPQVVDLIPGRTKALVLDGEKGFLFALNFLGKLNRYTLSPFVLDGIIPETIGAIYALTLDTIALKIYWIDASDEANRNEPSKKHRLKRSNYDGSHQENVFTLPYIGASNEIIWNMEFVDGAIFFIRWINTRPLKTRIQKFARGVLTDVEVETEQIYSLQYFGPDVKESFKCTNNLCDGKVDGNYEIQSVENKFLQCSNGNAYCTTCPDSLVFVEGCNACLFSRTDSCPSTSSTVSTLSTSPQPCPDECPKKNGGNYTGNIIDSTNPSRFIVCIAGRTWGCMNCPAELVFKESDNICDWP